MDYDDLILSNKVIFRPSYKQNNISRTETNYNKEPVNRKYNYKLICVCSCNINIDSTKEFKAVFFSEMVNKIVSYIRTLKDNYEFIYEDSGVLNDVNYKITIYSTTDINSRFQFKNIKGTTHIMTLNLVTLLDKTFNTFHWSGLISKILEFNSYIENAIEDKVSNALGCERLCIAISSFGQQSIKYDFLINDKIC